MTSAIDVDVISAEPLAGSLGAQITGLDLSEHLSDHMIASIRKAFLKYCVIVFPGQAHITPDDHAAFAARFGELHISPKALPSLAGNPAVLLLDPKDTKPHTDNWHSDVSMEERPPLGSLLLARQLPPAGGDTMFANQYMAYETLSDAMKEMIGRLYAVHVGDAFAKVVDVDPGMFPTNVHPVVRTHPETGRKTLFVNSVYTSHFEGMTVEESRPLLNWLCEHAVQPNFTFRHRWSVGDLVMWDNRCVQHYAIHDYAPNRRVMHRVTVLGDRPR